MSDSLRPHGLQPVLGISQAGTLEWVAISSSRGSFWPRDRTCISCVSCMGRRILYHWASWEAPVGPQIQQQRFPDACIEGDMVAQRRTAVTLAWGWWPNSQRGWHTRGALKNQLALAREWSGGWSSKPRNSLCEGCRDRTGHSAWRRQHQFAEARTEVIQGMSNVPACARQGY